MFIVNDDDEFTKIFCKIIFLQEDIEGNSFKN